MQNAETAKYLNIMADSLEKKSGITKELLSKTLSQSECISGNTYDDANWDQFNVLMVEKDALIERIDELDEGFDTLFTRVKSELDNNKEAYRDEILRLQTLITELTDMGVKISAAEERNRSDIERIMTSAKAGIGKARRNMKASSGYIASMYAGMNDYNKIDKKN